MKFDSSMTISSLSSLSNLPYVKEGSFYIVVVQGCWVTTAMKAFICNKEAFSKELRDNLLVTLKEDNHVKLARKYFKSNKYDDPTIVITTIRPDQWHSALETPKAIKISLGRLNEYNAVVKLLMRMCDLLNEKGESSFRTISWESKWKLVQQKLKDFPILSLISLVI